MSDLRSVTTEDLKGSISLWSINRHNIKETHRAEIDANALACANELLSRIGPNMHTKFVYNTLNLRYPPVSPTNLETAVQTEPPFSLAEQADDLKRCTGATKVTVTDSSYRPDELHYTRGIGSGATHVRVQDRYQDLIAAVKILTTIRSVVYQIESDSPAWVMLVHASAYLTKQARELLHDGRMEQGHA